MANLFGDHFEFHFGLNVLVEFDLGFVVAEFLDSLFVHHDLLAIDFDVAGLLDGVGDLDGVDGTEDLARGGGFGANGKLQAII